MLRSTALFNVPTVLKLRTTPTTRTSDLDCSTSFCWNVKGFHLQSIVFSNRHCMLRFIYGCSMKTFKRRRRGLVLLATVGKCAKGAGLRRIRNGHQIGGLKTSVDYSWQEDHGLRWRMENSASSSLSPLESAKQDDFLWAADYAVSLSMATVHDIANIPESMTNETLVSARSNQTIVAAKEAKVISAANNYTDFFLLSGQSNMIGHTTSHQSIGENGEYWLKIKSILDGGGDTSLMLANLKATIHHRNVLSDPYTTESITDLLARETIQLYNDGLLNNLDTPLIFGR
jgi:hypothetical protein